MLIHDTAALGRVCTLWARLIHYYSSLQILPCIALQNMIFFTEFCLSVGFSSFMVENLSLNATLLNCSMLQIGTHLQTECLIIFLASSVSPNDGS